MDTKNFKPSDIFSCLSLNTEEMALVNSKFEKYYLPKGEILIKAGETVKHQYFVYSGCLRTYYINQQGKEHTLQFAIHDWWISDYTAYFTTSKAIMNIESLQNAILYKISRLDLEYLYQQIPKIESFSRRKLEGSFSGFHKRILSNLAQSAKERYVSFINTYPNIEQNIKNYHIASYLGITTESLSRIRKELAQ